MHLTADDVAQLVLLIGAISAAAVAIIKALKENTSAVKAGTERAAVADEEKLSLARQGAQMDARKVELSEAIANPSVEAPQPARTAADPLEGRIQRIEEAIAVIRAALPPR